MSETSPNNQSQNPSHKGDELGGKPAPKPEDAPAPGRKCQDLPPWPELPKPKDPDPCIPKCCCTQPSTVKKDCLEDLIVAQEKQIKEAEHAKAFKDELTSILVKTNEAKKTYTRKKYEELKEIWKKQDAEILEKLKAIICAVPCLDCVAECEICLPLYSIRNDELMLYGDGKLTSEVYSLRDQLNWLTRKFEMQNRIYVRIQKVLAAWESPAETLEKVLNENQKLIEDIKKAPLADHPADAVYDLLVRLIPAHMAIRPRAGKRLEPSAFDDSDVGKKFIEFCDCDRAIPDDCCGPDTGEPTILRSMTGELPYLADPDELPGIICCLTSERYQPAKDNKAKTEAEMAAKAAEIEAVTARVKNLRDNLRAQFISKFEQGIDCDQYTCKDGSENPDDCGCKKHGGSPDDDCGCKKSEPPATPTTPTVR